MKTQRLLPVPLRPMDLGVRRAACIFWGLSTTFNLTACSGPQSALDPAGDEAGQVADLFWLMLIGSGVIWTAVIGTAVYATHLKRAPVSDAFALRFVIGGGIVVPVLVLAALLFHGLSLMPRFRAPGHGNLKIAASGEQFWFRIRYERPGAEPVESANEIRVPVGRRVEIALTSPDVIHSFWIPTLAGKTDMIPGRVNRLVVEATRPGTFRGACAEFCGPSHALMAFTVVAMEEAAYTAWLVAQSAPAEPAEESAAFLRNGCGACHTIRGTQARGRVGPDLTHLASRATIGAGTLMNCSSWNLI